MQPPVSPVSPDSAASSESAKQTKRLYHLLVALTRQTLTGVALVNSVAANRGHLASALQADLDVALADGILSTDPANATLHIDDNKLEDALTSTLVRVRAQSRNPHLDEVTASNTAAGTALLKLAVKMHRTAGTLVRGVGDTYHLDDQMLSTYRAGVLAAVPCDGESIKRGDLHEQVGAHVPAQKSLVSVLCKELRDDQYIHITKGRQGPVMLKKSPVSDYVAALAVLAVAGDERMGRNPWTRKHLKVTTDMQRYHFDKAWERFAKQGNTDSQTLIQSGVDACYEVYRYVLERKKTVTEEQVKAEIGKSCEGLKPLLDPAIKRLRSTGEIKKQKGRHGPLIIPGCDPSLAYRYEDLAGELDDLSRALTLKHNDQTVVDWNCPEHGIWSASVVARTQRNKNCPECTTTRGYNTDLPGDLYVLSGQVDGHKVVQFGISNYYEDRLKAHNGKGFTHVHQVMHFTDGQDPKDIETLLKQLQRELGVQTADKAGLDFSGKTEAWRVSDAEGTGLLNKVITTLNRETRKRGGASRPDDEIPDYLKIVKPRTTIAASSSAEQSSTGQYVLEMKTQDPVQPEQEQLTLPEAV